MSTQIAEIESPLSYDAIRELFRESTVPVLTTSDVAASFDITQQAAYKRLMSLHDDGEVERRKVGSRAVVWWLVG